MAIITLRKEELLYLDDGLTLLADIPDDTAKMVPGRHLAPMAVSVASADLLLKIGSALVYLADDGMPERDLDLTEEELWCIREVSQSNAVYFDKQVGLSLKIKIYRTLMTSYTEELLDESDIALTHIQDNPPPDIQKRLDAYHTLEDD